MVEQGELAPDFTLRNQDDRYVSLADFKGQKVVMYFYPKDMTSGCTAQAQSLRDMYDDFKERNIVILGISGDNADSHSKFKEKEKLPFDLLVDEDHELAQEYGAYDEEKPQRRTFLLDERGEVVHVLDNVNTKDHAEEVLDAWDTV